MKRQFYLIVDGPEEILMDKEVVFSLANGIKKQGSRTLSLVAIAAETLIKSSCCEVVSFCGLYEEGEGDNQRVCRAHGIYAPCTRKGRIVLETLPIAIAAAETG